MRSFFQRLQPRDRNALTVLAIGVLLILLFQYAVSPIMDFAQKARTELPLKEKRLRKYRQMVSMVGAAETDWKALDQRLAEAQKGLLDSKTAPLASAELQDRVKQLLSRQGIEPRALNFMAVRTLPPADSGYAAVPISLQFECPVDQVAGLVASLQSTGKMLAIEGLSIDAGPKHDPKSRKVVTVQMVIRGVMFAEPVPVRPGAGQPS
jgi:hypothetical protein